MLLRLGHRNGLLLFGALQASLLVVATGVAALGSGVVADALGYGAVFGDGALLTLLALLPVVRYFVVTQRRLL